MGDEVQAIKAGLLEVADLVVVNKGDRPGARRTAAQLRAMLVPTTARGEVDPDRPRPKRPEVLITTALTGEGIPELVVALDRHRAAGRAGASSVARRARAAAQVDAIVLDRFRERVLASDEAAALIDAVAAHELDPFSAADRLMELARGDPRPKRP